MSSFKRKNLAGGFVELNQSQEPDHTQWLPLEFGILVFQKDYGKRSYFFRLFDLESNTKSNDFIWEHEMYTQFEYYQLNTSFQYFPGEGCYIGFNFSNEEQAVKFFNVVNQVRIAREELYKNLNSKLKRNDSNTALINKARRNNFSVKITEKKLFGNFFGGNKTKEKRKSTVNPKKTRSNLSVDSIDSKNSRRQNKNDKLVGEPTPSYPPPPTIMVSSAQIVPPPPPMSLAPQIVPVCPPPPPMNPIPPPPMSQNFQAVPSSPPPPPSVSNSQSSERSGLLSEITSFSSAKLKKTKTVDKSALDFTKQNGDTKKTEKNPIANQLNALFQGNASAKPIIPPHRSPPQVPKQDKAIVQEKPKPMIVSSPQVAPQMSMPPPASGGPPPPPPPTLNLNTEPFKLAPSTPRQEIKPKVDPTEALLSSIRNFKGFKPKDEERKPVSKPPPPSLGLKDQLKDVLASRQAYFKQSSDESDSDVEW